MSFLLNSNKSFTVLTLLFLLSFWLALGRLRNGYDITDIPVAQ